MLEPKYTSLVEQYYARSIEQFRREVTTPAFIQRETTIYAGLVMCSLSVRLKAKFHFLIEVE